MARQARKKSDLCINHVILRGINQQIIFEEDTDYIQFISILKYYKELCNFKLYAYCLMDNHIHLLMEYTSVSIEVIMKRIEVKFAMWYNQKYQRVGHLFQDRYKSEPVNDMEYFKVVFRYIHQNPLKAGVELKLGQYPWSSYWSYVTFNSNFVDIEKIISLFSNHADCIEYLHTTSDKKCLEYGSSRISDIQALEIIEEKTCCKSPSDFQRLDLITRNKYLNLLYREGISVRQINRLTGTSRSAINTAVHNGSEDTNTTTVTGTVAI